VTASILRGLREWLALDEVAIELSAKLGEHVAVHDVLRLALDGHLRLSVYLPTRITATCQRLDDDSLNPEQDARAVQGLCDVPIKGRAQLQIEHEYHWECDGTHVPVDGPLARR
jgi:hypothetical protein